MQRLLSLLYQYRVFFFFLFLEVVSLWLITTYNNFYNAFLFNSSNQLAGTIQLATGNTRDYLELKETNKRLAEENAFLRKQLFEYSALTDGPDTLYNRFSVIPARVVNNDFKRSANYITIDKGERNGLEPGMGVISDNGIIGSIKSTSGRFSTVTSLLHQNQLISSEIKSTGTLCTTQWDASDPTHSKVRFIPRHIPINVGDTIVTSGFNSTFPPGLNIGVVSSYELADESIFYDVTIELVNDFSSIRNVYVIRDFWSNEKDSLEQVNE